MGIFDIFKSKERKTFGTLHGMDLREWNDGYKSKDKEIIKFVQKKLNSMTYEKFLKFLSKRENYRKFVDEEINDTMNKATVSHPKGSLASVGLPKFDYAYYPKNLLNHKDFDETYGFRIVDCDLIYEDKEFKKGNFKTLVKFNISNNQKWWGKRISSEKEIRAMSFQFIDLDENEYELIKDFENKIKKKASNLVDVWSELNTLFYNGLLATKKRKAYPINRFQTYLAFEE